MGGGKRATARTKEFRAMAQPAASNASKRGGKWLFWLVAIVGCIFMVNTMRQSPDSTPQGTPPIVNATPPKFRPEEQKRAAMFILGTAAGMATVCKFPDNPDYHI